MRDVVHSNLLVTALQSPRLAQAFKKLRLTDGHFQMLGERVKQGIGKSEEVRMFWVEGPKGGVRAILIAWSRNTRSSISIGVYVDSKSRRKGLGRLLVVTAREHYKRPFKVTAWSPLSSVFWDSVAPSLESENGYPVEISVTY